MLSFMSRNKRFNVTLPWGLGEALERWAASEGNKPTTLASFLVETAVREAIAAGRITPPQQALPPPDQADSPLSIQKLLFKALSEFQWNEVEAPSPIEAFAESALMEPERVRAILEGEKPTDDDVVALTRMVGWSLEELTALVVKQYGRNGNGKPKQVSRR